MGWFRSLSLEESVIKVITKKDQKWEKKLTCLRKLTEGQTFERQPTPTNAALFDALLELLQLETRNWNFEGYYHQCKSSAAYLAGRMCRQTRNRRWVEKLLSMAESSTRNCEWNCKAEIIYGLGWIEDDWPEVSKQCAANISAMMTKHAENRDLVWSACSALEKLRDPDSTESILNILRYNTEPWCRQAAAEALGSIGDNRAVSQLEASLNDYDGSVRRNAAEALGKIKHQGSVEALIDRLNKEEDEFTQYRLVKALGAIGSKDAIEPLKRFLQELPPKLERTRRCCPFEAVAEVLTDFGWWPEDTDIIEKRRWDELRQKR